MNKRAYAWLVPGILALAAAGCGKPVVKDSDIIQESHVAAEVLQLAAESPKGVHAPLERHRPLLIASFVNIDNTQASSTFGRMLAEQVGSYFTQHGYDVIELRLRNDVLIKEETGELLLSRELRDITQQHDAQAVVVGTYAVGSDTVFVTTKVIRALDGVVQGSHDYSLSLGPNTKALLQNDRYSARQRR
jgi:TolB-like protein